VLTNLRNSSLFHHIRRSRIFIEYVRPIYGRWLMRTWWAEGRPAPPPHDVKLAAILYLADRINAEVLIETGSYRGDTVRTLRGRFELIASIEIAPSLLEPLQREFAADDSVRMILGDSGKELTKLLNQIKQPVVFWLDAHYSGGPTLGEGYVPIKAELDIISRYSPSRHAILIDDMREFKGENGYPTASEIVDHLRLKNYEAFICNDMLHAIPHAASRDC
jgi:hypothetical protein